MFTSELYLANVIKREYSRRVSTIMVVSVLVFQEVMNTAQFWLYGFVGCHVTEVC